MVVAYSYSPVIYVTNDGKTWVYIRDQKMSLEQFKEWLSKLPG
jgi:hypothetical protein